MWTLVARALAKAVSVTGLLALLAGVPAIQVGMVGWPLPQHMPSLGEVGDALVSRHWLTDTTLVNTLSVLLWLLWALFAASVVVELGAAARGITAPRYRLLAPTQGLAALLVAGLLSGTPAPAAHAPLTTAPVPALTWASAATSTTVVSASSGHPAAGTVAAMPVATPADAVLGPHFAPNVAPSGTDLATPHPVAEGPVYEVMRGDWLWHISARYLGDPLRYVEIEALNPNLELRDHRFPDHIEATWHVRLPVDAQDRGPRLHAAGHLVTQPAPPAEPAPTGPDGAVPPTIPAPTPTQAEPTPAPTPSVSSSSSAAPTPAPGPAVTPPTADRDGVVEPGPTPARTAAPTANPPTTPTPTPTATPAGTTPAASSSAADAPELAPSTPATDEHGVTLPYGSGWLPWTLVGALVAAAAMVWLQRRRTYKPRSMDGTTADERPDPPDLPPTMKAVQRAWRRRPDPLPAPPLLPRPAENSGGRSARPPSAIPPPPLAVPPVPVMEPLPPGGLGVTGPGAESAARGALVAALASGAPTDPDAQSIVVIPADDMMTLLGADAITVGTWPRLRVTPDLDTALKVLEARLLRAARLLDEHETTELADLRAPDSTAPPLAPVLLVASAPSPAEMVRVRMVLGLGQRVDITAVLLGEWRHGPSVTVALDGTCSPQGGVDTPAPSRLAVLDTTAARDLLHALREAHTGEPDQPAAHDPAASHTHEDDERPTSAANYASESTVVGVDQANGHASVPVNSHDSPDSTDDDGRSADDHVDHVAGAVRARVNVLGQPRIADWPRDIRLRAYALELLTYLAVHSDGATSDQIMEDLWPDTRRGPASQRLHAATSNLRQLLAGSLPPAEDGEERPAPLVKVSGRWRLDPIAVDVDLWRLRAAHGAARARTGQARVEALREVCRLFTGPLAGDEDYEWIDRHRQGVLTLAIDAHVALATAVAAQDQAEAVRLLQVAVEHDPVNEEVACQLMRAQHRVGDLDAIRATLRRLKLGLEELGVEPSQQTLDLADELRRDLNHRAPGVRS